MKLSLLLKLLKKTQETIQSSPVFLTGGAPRDRYLKSIGNIDDIDLTSGDKSIQYTQVEFYKILAKKFNVTSRTFEDGHSSINIGSFKLDFSSNFNAPNIEKLLAAKNIVKPTAMQKEMFSRDFNCNALLLTTDFKNIIDVTGNGLKDLDNKLIRTCLAPEVTLMTNKNRVARVIYMASKLEFSVDKSIIEFVVKNPQSIKLSTRKSLSTTLNKAFDYDADRASYYLSKMKLWSHVPITEIMRPYFIKSTRDDNSLWKTNRDYVGDINHIDFANDSSFSFQNNFNTLDFAGLGPLLPENDFEGKDFSSLNLGRDYDSESPFTNDKITNLEKKYLINSEPETNFLGLPDGFNHSDEEDLMISNKNKYYNLQGPNSTIYSPFGLL